MCRADGCCGGFVGLCVFVGCIFSLGFPWYFSSFTVGVDSIDCTLLFLQSWSQMYILTTPSCPDGLKDQAKSFNWRNLCNDVSSSFCSDMFATFDVTLAFLVLSSVCGIAVMVGSFARCCCQRQNRMNWHVGSVFVGLACLIISVIVFAVRYPQSIPDSWCDVDEALGFNCHQFWGSKSASIGDFTGTFVWGPAGWVSAAVCIIFYALAACLSVQRGPDAGSYSALQGAQG